MKTIINGNEYTLTKITLGMAIKFQREFGTDVFVEAGKIDLSKEYLNLEDVVRVKNIIFASIWFVNNKIKLEDFENDFFELDKKRIEEMIFQEINFIFAGLETKAESKKK